jgi:hypothetical protein
MKYFICDKCGSQFNSPLDEESFVDEHNVTTIYDLCAPCRKDLKADKVQKNKDFFVDVIKPESIKITMKEVKK